MQNSLEPEGGMLQENLCGFQLFGFIAKARLKFERVLLNQFEGFLAGNRFARTELKAGKVRHTAYQLGIQKTPFLRQSSVCPGLEFRNSDGVLTEDRCLGRDATERQKQSEHYNSHFLPSVKQIAVLSGC